jgi:hypothetical protein
MPGGLLFVAIYDALAPGIVETIAGIPAVRDTTKC